MNEAAAKAKTMIAEAYSKLSSQEKTLILVALLIGVLFIVTPIYEGVDGIFAKQRQKLRTIEGNAKITPKKISEYLALEKRRDEVKERYKKVELKQGVRSHIETLIRTHIGANTNPTIQNLNVKKIGQGYLQEPFKVGFKTDSLKTLSKFLKELVEGPQPLVLSRLVIKRSRSGDKLQISLDTSSIRAEQ